MGKAYYTKEYQTNYMFENKYGMSYQDVVSMLAAQNGRCSICKDQIAVSQDEVRNTAHVDHDHESGIVRGLLCSKCNTGLGMFKDNIRNLAQAIVYLEDHGKSFKS